MNMSKGRRMPPFAAAMVACFGLVLLVSRAHAGALGNYFEHARDSAGNGDLIVSIDSLFMFRADDMNSVLMSNSQTGAPAFQAGPADLGTIFGPMVNVTRDFASGWGAGFRYYSLIDGSETSDQIAPAGQQFTENFNGLGYTDLGQFNTSYTVHT